MKVTTALSFSILNQAAGVFFYAKSTSRYLYLLRNDDKNNTWSIPGGKIEKDETLYEGIARECTEELGFFDNDWKLIPIQKFVNKNFVYHTFFCQITDEFIPDLNFEHTGYAWVNEGYYPKPLHPGLFSTVNIDIVTDKLKQLEK
jgi:8-oxo-dGTP pyrophosphatase MutT (NUDIX family)